jgi:hypothetical protein
MKPARSQHCLRLAFALSLTINVWSMTQTAHARSPSAQGPSSGTGSGPFIYNGDLRSLSTVNASALTESPKLATRSS